MNDLDVEAVDDATGDAGADPQYVLYGGKGGVGKTTMAAASALASARQGVETLVVSTDPAHSLSDTLEVDVGPTPTAVLADDPLSAAEIDPDAALEESVAFGEDGSLGALGEIAGEDGPMDALMGGAMPGADEAAAMQTLMRYLEDDRFDRVVVDTAPTGHTLRLLELPEVMDTMVGRMVRMRERVGDVVAGIAGVFGGGSADDDDGGGEDLEALRERIERLRTRLRDPATTDFRVVMQPEAMSVDETERLLERLDAFGIPVGTVVVNKVMEDLASVAAGQDGPWSSPDLEDCAFCQRRWEVQQDALARAQDVFRDHEVRRVPLLAEEVRGREALSVVAACLDDSGT